MRKLTVAVLTVSMLVAISSVALALEKPTVYTPKEGAALGPSYDITGSVPHRAFMVVMTDVLRADNGQLLRSVPGIRHWTEQDGTFHFRCASPRVSIGEKDTPLVYRVRCFEASPTEGDGPETVVNCRESR